MKGLRSEFADRKSRGLSHVPIRRNRSIPTVCIHLIIRRSGVRSLPIDQQNLEMRPTIGGVTGKGIPMSYMGYYFYPDAMESIKDNPNGRKKRPAGRPKALSIVALAAGLFVLLLFFIAL